MHEKEIGELEELIIEEFSSAEDDDFIENLSSGEDELSENMPESKFFETAVSMLRNDNVCSLFLDKNLTILDISPAAYKLLGKYHNMEKKPLFNVLGSILDRETANEFLENIRSPYKNYSWNGTLEHKAKGVKTMRTRMNVIPLFSAGKPGGFWVIFQDITAAYLENQKKSLFGLLEASKLKDNDTGFHNERLNHYCKALSIVLFTLDIFPEIDCEFIENISFLAAMHDVGKIGTPDYILQKNGKLDESEWKIMKEHTINGGFILSNFSFTMAADMAFRHHEKWDGSGYPHGWAGEMIPLSARIIAVADVYDALRMKRPYKIGYSHKETVEHILNGSGTHFDPRIIKVFEKVHFLFDKIWLNMQDVKNNGLPSEQDAEEEEPEQKAANV